MLRPLPARTADACQPHGDSFAFCGRSKFRNQQTRWVGLCLLPLGQSFQDILGVYATSLEQALWSWQTRLQVYTRFIQLATHDPLEAVAFGALVCLEQSSIPYLPLTLLGCKGVQSLHKWRDWEYSVNRLTTEGGSPIYRQAPKINPNITRVLQFCLFSQSKHFYLRSSAGTASSEWLTKKT